MRHADAGATTDQPDDNQRPLTQLGQQQANAAGTALAKIGSPIHTCLASTVTRAAQTAQLACKHLNITPQPDDRLDGYPLDTDWLKTASATSNLLIVTHMPSVQLIVFKLTGAQIRFAKAAIAQIHQGELWALFNPSTCYAIAGIPLPDGGPQAVDERAADPADQPLHQARRNASIRTLKAPTGVAASRS